jgi:hypothetical protein
MHLDALTQSGQARRALVEARRGLLANPQLLWARVAWARLPEIWRRLGVSGFAWREEDGVPALLERLAVRPRPKLAGMILAAD